MTLKFVKFLKKNISMENDEDMNPNAPKSIHEWKETFSDNVETRERAGKEIADHYGMEKSCGWMFWRSYFE